MHIGGAGSLAESTCVRSHPHSPASLRWHCLPLGPYTSPSSTQAAGKGRGRPTYQGVGEKGRERRSPCCPLLPPSAAPKPALCPEEGVPDTREKPPGEGSLKISRRLPLGWALPLNSCLFLASRHRNPPFGRAERKTGIGRNKQGAQGANLREALDLRLVQSQGWHPKLGLP